MPFFQQEEQLSLTAEQLSPLSSLNNPTDISAFAPLTPRTLSTLKSQDTRMMSVNGDQTPEARATDLYGLPPLTAAVRAELNNANLLKDYKQAPRFDMAHPHRL